MWAPTPPLRTVLPMNPGSFTQASIAPERVRAFTKTSHSAFLKWSFAVQLLRNMS